MYLHFKLGSIVVMGSAWSPFVCQRYRDTKDQDCSYCSSKQLFWWKLNTEMQFW